MLDKIDPKFFESNLDFGRVNAKKPEPRSMCVTSRTKVLVTSKSGAKSNLRASSVILNRFINQMTKQTYNLRDDQVVRLFENMEQLNKKIAVWNDKVKNSTRIKVVHTLLKIVSCNLYHYQKALSVTPLNVEKIREPYIQSKKRLISKYKITKEVTETVSKKFNEFYTAAKKSIEENTFRFARDFIICRIAECVGIPAIAVQVALFAMDYFLP